MVFDFISFVHTICNHSFVHMAVHVFELIDPDLGMNLDPPLAPETLLDDITSTNN